MLIHFATSFDTPVEHVTLVTWLLTDPPCCHTLIVEVYVLPSKKPTLEYLVKVFASLNTFQVIVTISPVWSTMLDDNARSLITFV